MTDNQLQCNYERGKRKGEVSESAMFEIVCWASASSTSRQKINRVSRYLAMRLFIVFLPATPHLLLLFSCCCCSSCNCSWNLFSASFRPRPRNGALEPQTRKAIDAVPCRPRERERGRVGSRRGRPNELLLAEAQAFSFNRLPVTGIQVPQQSVINVKI